MIIQIHISRVIRVCRTGRWATIGEGVSLEGVSLEGVSFEENLEVLLLEKSLEIVKFDARSYATDLHLDNALILTTKSKQTPFYDRVHSGPHTMLQCASQLKSRKGTVSPRESLEESN